MKKLYRRERAEIRQANRSLGSDRLTYEHDMATAEVLADLECFYIPHNLDWRGRSTR